MKSRHTSFVIFALAGALVLISLSRVSVRAQTPADDDAKIWAGVYTSEQAARGKNIYEAYCTRCHGLNLLGGRQGGVGGPALKDTNFWVSWERQPLSALYGKIQRTMPADSPASLREDDYTDVTAYMLAENAFPSGKANLPANGLDAIRIARRPGEASEVPDFSLVQVVGCLTARPDHRWVLTQASEPALTRDEAASAAELAESVQRPAGTTTLALIGAGQFKAEAMAGRRVEARGLLNKDAEQARLDLLSLKSVGPACSN
jgi:mono/diheme cytochrome c family protein